MCIFFSLDENAEKYLSIKLYTSTTAIDHNTHTQTHTHKFIALRTRTHSHTLSGVVPQIVRTHKRNAAPTTAIQTLYEVVCVGSEADDSRISSKNSKTRQVRHENLEDSFFYDNILALCIIHFQKTNCDLCTDDWKHFYTVCLLFHKRIIKLCSHNKFDNRR